MKFFGGMITTDAEMRDVSDFGNFEFKSFDTKTDLEAYLSAPDYNTPNKPGMCFGFQVTIKDKKKYELEVFSNDKWPSIRRFSPDSELREVQQYSAMP